jgi:hypothetical protein
MKLPPLLVNKVFPLAHETRHLLPMSTNRSFQIFLSLLSLRRTANDPNPSIIQRTVRSTTSTLPPYHSEDDDDEEDIDDVPDQSRDEHYDDDLGGDEAWGNVVGEPGRN